MTTDCLSTFAGSLVERDEAVSWRSSASSWVTPNERRVLGAATRADGWAGRLAAKRAVCDLLGIPHDVEHLRSIEVLPRAEGVCTDAARCRRGHPPTVALRGVVADIAGGRHVLISISHDRGDGFAVACFGELGDA